MSSRLAVRVQALGCFGLKGASVDKAVDVVFVLSEPEGL